MSDSLLGCTSEYMTEWIRYQLRNKYGTGDCDFDLHQFVSCPPDDRNEKIRMQCHHWTNLQPLSHEDGELKDIPTDAEVDDRATLISRFVAEFPPE